MEHVSTSERIVRGVLIALVLVFFLFPIFWILLMSFQTNETDPAHPAQPVLRADARQLHGAADGPAGDHRRQSRHRLHAEPRQQRAAVDLLGAAVAAAGRAGGLCLRALPLPARREHRVHPAVVPLRAAAAGAAAAQPLFQAARPDRHLYRPRLGLPADLPAADPLDRARLFRGHQPGHRARLPHLRPLLAGRPSRASPFRWRGRASRPPDCSPSSSPGTTSCSRSSWPRPTSSR